MDLPGGGGRFLARFDLLAPGERVGRQETHFGPQCPVDGQFWFARDHFDVLEQKTEPKPTVWRLG